ncbi:response regulator [Chryseobacterium sp. HR92]|uniref:hybrid sensor histidine kinase/response regulator transcription factor n=1 Tax=Chryseobacterium sp. HR92 TaxID=3094839 RepID=UPI003890C89D|nr:response regulator [Chryseobacterium sp. HR92]
MLFPIYCKCQQYQIISTSDGLPQSFVSGIVQDNSGFLWIATKNGLARYDGVHYKVFHHNPMDSNSINGDLIICLKYFDNAVWIEYKSGDIDRLNTVTEEITHYFLKSTLEKSGLKMLKRGWIIGCDHLLWAICEQNNIISYNFKRRKLEKYIFRNTQRNLNLWGIQEDHKGILWAITDKGILSYNKKKGFYTHYQLPISAIYRNDVVVGNTALDLYFKSNGDFLWGDTENLYTYSVVNHRISKVKLPGKDKENVLWIKSGRDGNVYFERGGKVWQYNKIGLLLINDVLHKSSIAAKSFFMDRTGVIWIGTDARGILKIDLNTPEFYSFSPADTFPDNLLKREFNMSLSKTFKWTAADSEFSLPGYHIRSSYDRNGKLWIGVKNMVTCYDPYTRKLTQLPEIKGLEDKNSRGIGLKGLAFNESGSPIVAGYNGNLLFYDGKTSAWKWFLPPGFLKVLFGENLVLSDMCADNERLWLTTETNGVFYITLKDRRVYKLKWGKQEPLLGIRKDPKRTDVLWIGSYHGLICLYKKTLKTKIFTMRQGLPDNTVYALSDDSKGNLWFSTNKGLCRFDPRNYRVRVFQSQYGLPGNEFNRFHCLQLPDGRLSFGGPEGWVLFDPTKIRDSNYQPEVAFTSLKVNNIEVNHHKKNGILDRPVNEMKELFLDYDQNTFMMSFAGMEFNQPQDLKFRYQLVGYDKEWVECGNIPFANYTRLPSGNYEFRVNCSNSVGKWSEKIKTVKLSVASPWWLKWWAYMIYAVLFFAGVGYWLYLQRLRIKLEQSIAFKQKETEQLKQLTEMKSRFFTNMTHDFRTPLTLILSPLSELKEYLAGSSQEKNIDSIQKNSEELLDSVNRLLSLSKLEEKLPISGESIGSISDFVEGVVDQFKSMALSKDIDLSFSSDVNNLYRFDMENLKGILFNLIGNSLKFTLSGGKINVIVKKGLPDGIVLIVEDTGIGIPDSDKPFIFNRYFQSEKNSKKLNVHGSGIGLFLVQEFVSSQQGTIKMESTEGEGTVFMVHMPYPAIGSQLSNESRDHFNRILLEKEIDRNDENPVILLVEDNVDMSEFILDILPSNYIVIRAFNGEEGLMVAKEIIPDLIVADLMMPVMDGLTLCKELKNNDKTSHIPIIILSAKENMNSQLEGLESGADDYLVKPFNIQDLTLRIQNNLESQIRYRKLLAAQFNIHSNVEKTKVIDPFLQKLYTILENDLSNSSVGIEEFAGLLHVSRVQLHRKIKAITGKTSVEVVRNYRLERAAEFLKEGYNSSEAAFKAGFESPAYFSKCFKAYYKLTPSAFVKDHLK